MNHFHFPSNTVASTVEFYESFFGFRKKITLGKTQVLENGERFLLAIDESYTTAPLSERIHLGFRLENAAEVSSLHTRMKKEGVAAMGDLMNPSPHALHFYCADPSGNRLEIGWYAFVTG